MKEHCTRKSCKQSLLMSTSEDWTGWAQVRSRCTNPFGTNACLDSGDWCRASGRLHSSNVLKRKLSILPPFPALPWPCLALHKGHWVLQCKVLVSFAITITSRFSPGILTLIKSLHGELIQICQNTCKGEFGLLWILNRRTTLIFRTRYMFCIISHICTTTHVWFIQGNFNSVNCRLASCVDIVLVHCSGLHFRGLH